MNEVMTKESTTPMHPSMARLLEAAALRGVDGPSDLALKMGESSQTIGNWRRRGVSQAGALNASQRMGCAVEWVLKGRGSSALRDPTPAIPTSINSRASLSDSALTIGLLFDELTDRIVRAKAQNALTEVLLRFLEPHATTPSGAPTPAAIQKK